MAKLKKQLSGLKILKNNGLLSQKGQHVKHVKHDTRKCESLVSKGLPYLNQRLKKI